MEPIETSPAQISHYACRSLEEFECKRARGRGAVAPNAPDEIRPASAFERMDRNAIQSDHMQELVPAVQEEVERLRAIVHGTAI